MLDNLLRDSDHHNPKIIAGDFNAWAVEWGSRKTNTRGRILLEALSGRDLVLANNGQVPTFTARDKNSVVDLTFVTSSLARGMSWRVSEHYTHSDHRAIMFSINIAEKSNKITQASIPLYTGWAVKKLDKALFIQEIDNNLEMTGSATEMANQISSMVKRACDLAMPKRRISGNNPPNYWWNSEISNLRSMCLRARRRTQRLIGKPNFEEACREFQIARRKFQHAISRSKRNSFKRICLEANSDPWGKAYRVVTSLLKGCKSPQPRCPLLLKNIVTTLFPEHRITIRSNTSSIGYISPVTEEELIQITEQIGDNKTPGPDGFPNIALKLAIKSGTKVFADVFNLCLKEGIFPNQWKKQNLVLIPKPNKPQGDPSAYRPICLLDTTGKILEKIIYNRLLPVVEEKNGLSNLQYGFRKARSTIDAIGMVVDIARTAIDGKGANRKYCALITLDVKNAFNSASWDIILQKLYRIGVPEYLARIIESYFTDRKLCYHTDVGIVTHRITAGVAQGSVLGTLLWNIMYNDVLELNIPK